MRHELLLTSSLALILSCGCSDGDDNPGDTDTDTNGGDLVATVAPSPYVPAVALVSFDGEGEAFVEYGLAGAFDLRTPSSAGPTHEIPVIGLKAGQTWDWKAVLVDGDGNRLESAPGTFVVPPSPLPPLTVDTTVGTPDAFGGHLMLAVIDRPADNSWVGFFDSDGDWVWWVDSPGNGIVSAEFGADGASVVFGAFANDLTVDTSHVVRVSMDGRARTETRLLRGHHDFVEHPEDGTFAFLSLETRDVDMDDDGIVTFGADAILRGPEGMTDGDVPDAIYSTFDYSDADPDVAPAFVCPHVQPELAGTQLGLADVVEWTHGNSLVYLPTENAYYLLARYADWLLKIDASTGEVLWQLNGWFPAVGDFSNGTLWSHPHLSDLWDAGALLFDNGDHYSAPGGPSRVVQVSWDEVAMTAQEDFEITRPGGGFASAIGDSRRLPDDRIVTAWGNLSDVTIHGAGGGAAEWRATIAPGQFAARIRYTDDLYALPSDP